MSVQAPILLRTGERLTVSTMTVTLSTDALPTAEITTPDAPKMHDLVEIFTAQGSAGVFRVTDRQEAYGGMVSVSLRGALDTLSDDLWEGENAVSGTIPTVIAQILSHQTVTRWQLGTCARTNSIRLENRYSGLLELLDGVLEEAPGCRWVYDYTTTPWTLSLAEMDPTVVAEFRVGRNIESASIDLSDAEMCTRLYMTVSTDSSSRLYTYNNIEAQAEWGVICRTADVRAENCPDPEAYGRAILAERAQPIAYITLDGFDLAALTGDAFDRITLGSHCRVTLDGYATAFEELVTQITWPDVFGEPEHINVSLANNLKPFAEQLNLIKRTSSGTASLVEEQERELVRHQTSIDRTDERITLWATEEQWYELAQEYSETGRTQVDITSDEISSVVTQAGVLPGVKPFTPTKAYAVGDHVIWAGKTWEFIAAHAAGTPWNAAEVTEVKALETRITQTESDITAEVTQRQSADNTLSTSLNLKADKATLISQINNSTESDPIAYGKLQVQPGSVLIQAINGGGQSSDVTISADKVNLEGYVTATDLSAGTISAITMSADGNITTELLHVNDILYAHDVVIQRGSAYESAVTDGDLDSEGVVTNLSLTYNSTTNMYTLAWNDYDGTPHSETFSRATSTSLGGAWNNGVYTVTASPQGETVSTKLSIVSGASTITSNGTYNYSVMYEDENQDDQPTGLTKTITVNVGGTSHSVSASVQSGTYASREAMEAAYPGHSWASLGSVSSGWRAVKVTCGSSTKWYFYVGT